MEFYICTHSHRTSTIYIVEVEVYVVQQSGRRSRSSCSRDLVLVVDPSSSTTTIISTTSLPQQTLPSLRHSSHNITSSRKNAVSFVNSLRCQKSHFCHNITLRFSLVFQCFSQCFPPGSPRLTGHSTYTGGRPRRRQAADVRDCGPAAGAAVKSGANKTWKIVVSDVFLVLNFCC